MVFGLGKKKSGGAAPTSSIDVALIGCGPGGMAFLHALSNLRKEQGADGPASKINVTCFERAASAGGIWRDVPEDDPKRNRPENAPCVQVLVRVKFELVSTMGHLSCILQSM